MVPIGHLVEGTAGKEVGIASLVVQNGEMLLMLQEHLQGYQSTMKFQGLPNKQTLETPKLISPPMAKKFIKIKTLRRKPEANKCIRTIRVYKFR